MCTCDQGCGFTSLYEVESSQDTELIVHDQLNADIRRLYKLKVSFADSAKQYFHLPLEQILSRPPRNRQRWLQLARLVAARASDRDTGQQNFSTFYPYNPPPSKPVQLHHQRWLCILLFNNSH